MVQNIFDIGEREDRILNIVKAQHGLKNKSAALALIVKIYGDSFLEPELRPEYLKKLEKIEEEGYSETFSSIEQLRKK
ncbi:antitoxin [Candidatus Woesearchaeota archaeon CG10_big_fil_rev_8_21_14_0_10_34_12]|nr:MAG: antitoxin [Candidatus Woesearchaeota archaeon CG10_big_fil_rev_8_21_14_0_10_34_12]